MISFDIITLFPGIFESPLQESIIHKAQQKGLVHITVHDLRDYTADRHRTADDTPYGGGAGMVMKAEPIITAIEAIKLGTASTRTVLLTPQGSAFNQKTAQRLHAYSRIILVCGRYEGVDERVLSFVDEEISIGDYILTGGEIAAMAVVDTISRLVPGVVGDMNSVLEDTFSRSLLKYPQYTRPSQVRGYTVPEILTSGDHGKIDRWRRIAAVRKTAQKRPDLLEKAVLTEEEKEIAGKIIKSERVECDNECN